MAEFTLTPQNFPSGYCYPANPQEFLDAISKYLTVNFNEQLSFFNYGPTTPGVDYQDRPWIKTTATGAPDGVWVFYGGTWRRNEYFVKGMIVPFYGVASAVEIPWQICDGSAAINGVTIPDLRDKFIVGAGSTYSVADTGGEANHQLTVNELPAHQHPSQSGYGIGFFTANPIGTVIQTGTGTLPFHTEQVGFTGGDIPHNNLPPYEAFYWLIYVGYY